MRPADPLAGTGAIEEEEEEEEELQQVRREQNITAIVQRYLLDLEDRPELDIAWPSLTQGPIRYYSVFTQGRAP